MRVSTVRWGALFLLLGASACGDEEGMDVCGDGVCQTSEDATSCAMDCSEPTTCGDGSCDADESVATCPADCTVDPCGDGTCAEGETFASCPADCPDPCGDGTCAEGETFASCPADCPDPCGDGTCAADEDATSCPEDCGVTCEADWPADPADNVDGPTAVITSLFIEDCAGRDQTGDDMPDNAYAAFAANVAGLLLESETYDDHVAAQIESGLLTDILVHAGLDDTSEDAAYDVAYLIAEEDEFEGDYLADWIEVDGFPGLPANRLACVELSGGEASGAADDLYLPLHGFGLGSEGLAIPYFRVSDVELVATLGAGVGGSPEYVSGSFTGAVSAEAFAEYFQDFIDVNCACLGLDTPVFALEGGSLVAECATDASTCDESGPEAVCSNLCGFAPSSAAILSGAMDVDRDANGDADALSVGLCFTASPASLSGLL